NGGFVETSGKSFLVALGSVNASAPLGKPGSWLLDPLDLNVCAAGDPAAACAGTNLDSFVGDGGVGFVDGPATGASVVTSAAIEGTAGSVFLQAGHDVSFFTDINKTNGGLAVTSGNDVNLNASIISVTGALSFTGGHAINSSAAVTSTQLFSNG